MEEFVEPPLGLRRRHQARLFQQQQQQDDDGSNTEGNERDERHDAIVAPHRQSPMIGTQPPRSLFGTPLQAPTENTNMAATAAAAVENNRNDPQNATTGAFNLKVGWYCFFSTILLVVAIVAATPPPHSSFASLIFLDQNQGNDGAHVGAMVSARSEKHPTTHENVDKEIAQDAAQEERQMEDFYASWSHSFQQWWRNSESNGKSTPEDPNRKSEHFEYTTIKHHNHDNNKQKPWWSHFAKKPNHDCNLNAEIESDDDNVAFIRQIYKWMPTFMKDFVRSGDFHHYLQWVDPVVLHPTPNTPTDIIDKVLTSTTRLLIVANFMLAMTYLLHTAVASWFLGPHSQSQHNEANNGGSGGGIDALQRQQQSLPPGLVMDWSNSSAGSRERLGGFLVFKLLLISAVVAPDTLDLLILLTWYTWLSCLRSLDHLSHTTTTHLAALGRPPRTGAVQLLFLVLGCDILATAFCVALFHSAGWSMVLLLTCDCALLGADVLSHILKYLQCALEDSHTLAIRRLEARQLELHQTLHGNNTRSSNSSDSDGETNNELSATDDRDFHDLNVEDDLRERAAVTMTRMEVQGESGRLDRRMEGLELLHTRRLSILDSIMFSLDLICQMLTVAHFVHIWSFHGVQFTLIDAVLALHLHSAISTVCKKIAQRQNVHSIARDLQGHFPNASEEELQKASAAGDVCCICLGSMSTGGHVKKVKCGHLYHTHCLREVVERAQSLQAAKCALCRASLTDGRNATFSQSPNGGRDTPLATPNRPFPPAQVAANNPQDAGQRLPQDEGERALFRFSTETILPSWLPVPAFSFEVVRRPPLGTQLQPQVPVEPMNRVAQGLANELSNADALSGLGNQPLAREQQGGAPAQPETSFLRRLLVLAGAIPMSAEEEAAALAQLVDMFPQYDRSDLLRELRERGSAEAVAEAVLVGVFSGIPRGD